ncbi:MAG: DHHA1 domain-containing protein, partial [bacterium]
VSLASQLGIDVIILDHHEPHKELPDALAVINPKRADSGYPFRDLAAVGVAYKFIQAAAKKLKLDESDIFEESVEIIALGTIADLMPLVDENRIFVTQGLARMRCSGNPGISALIDVSRFSLEQDVDTYQISFGLAPRLNAAGRIWNPRAGVELLLTKDMPKAISVARRLDEKNRHRMKEEARILDSALKTLERDFDTERDRIIVLENEKWHVGVIGIVASRILERHYRPVILFTLSKRNGDMGNNGGEAERVFAGSARSISEINMCDLLEQASDLMISFGGHSMAAGMKIYEKNIPALRRRLNETVKKSYGTNNFRRNLVLDSKVRLEEITLELLQQAQMMEPCGIGNPRPVFCTEGVDVAEVCTCGADGKHLRMKVKQGRAMLDVIGFGLSHAWKLDELRGQTVDISYTLKEDNFRNRRAVALQLRDIRSADK